MNKPTILEDIKTVLAGINGRVLDGAMVTEDEQRFVLAVQRLDQFIGDAETEVCPDWSKAPEWAQWWAVDANGETAWYSIKPMTDEQELCWFILHDGSQPIPLDAGIVTLPTGHDWRLSLQKRPA